MVLIHSDSMHPWVKGLDPVMPRNYPATRQESARHREMREVRENRMALMLKLIRLGAGGPVGNCRAGAVRFPECGKLAAAAGI